MLPYLSEGSTLMPSSQDFDLMMDLSQSLNNMDSTTDPGVSAPQMETPQSLEDSTVNPTDLTAEVQSPPGNQYDSPP